MLDGCHSGRAGIEAGKAERVVALLESSKGFLIVGGITGTVVGIDAHAVDTGGQIGEGLVVVVGLVVELGIAKLLEAGGCALPTGVVVVGIGGVGDIGGVVGRCGGRHAGGLPLDNDPYQVVGSLADLLGGAGGVVIDGLHGADIDALVLGKSLVDSGLEGYGSLVGDLLGDVALILGGSDEGPAGLPQLGVVVGRIVRRGVAEVDAGVVLLGDQTEIGTGVSLGVEGAVLGREADAVGTALLGLEGEELLHVVGLVAVDPDALDTLDEGVHHLALGLHGVGQVVGDVVELVLLDPYLIALGSADAGTGVPVVGTEEEGIGIGVVKVQCFTCLQRHGGGGCGLGPLGMSAHNH